MKILASVCALVGMLVVAPALARDVKVGPDETIATVSFPDSWAVSGIKRGIEAKSPDEEVYVWIETVPEDQTSALQKEHDDYFEKEGVTIKPNPPMKKLEVDGHKWAFIEPEATYEGGPTMLRYIMINPGHPSGKLIVFTYWASPKGDKSYDKEMNETLDSLKKSIAAAK